MDGMLMEQESVTRGRVPRHPLREHARACGFTDTNDFTAALAREKDVAPGDVASFVQAWVKTYDVAHSVRALCKRMQPLRLIYAGS